MIKQFSEYQKRTRETIFDNLFLSRLSFFFFRRRCKILPSEAALLFLLLLPVPLSTQSESIFGLKSTSSSSLQQQQPEPKAEARCGFSQGKSANCRHTHNGANLGMQSRSLSQSKHCAEYDSLGEACLILHGKNFLPAAPSNGPLVQAGFPLFPRGKSASPPPSSPSRRLAMNYGHSSLEEEEEERARPTLLKIWFLLLLMPLQNAMRNFCICKVPFRNVQA